MNDNQISLDFLFIGKISIDNKSRFEYQGGYGGRLIDVSICWVVADSGKQFSSFDSFASKKQLHIFREL